MSVEAAVASEPLVLNSQEGGVVRLTLNRGHRFNPLALEMIAAIQKELDAIAGDPAARVIVLAAEGKGFCAGHDLKDCSRMMVTLTRLPQPVIARVHGIATAAGCQLVSMCDIAVASDTATFAMPGVNVGVFCSTPAVGVARNVGRKRAMEMLLTGKPIDARTALAWGLVNRVVPAAELDAAVAEFTEAVLARSPAVVRLGKAAFYRQIEQPLEAAHDSAGAAMARNLTLEDAAEGMDAFLGKRPARWRDR